MKKKWSWVEMTSNKSGKTSGSGTMGSITIGVGLIGFIISLSAKIYLSSIDINLVYQSIIVITIGAGLLGYRKKKEHETNDIEHFLTNKDDAKLQEI